MVRLYKVLQSESLQRLAEHVTASLEQGWQPCGGVSQWTEHSQDNYGNKFTMCWFIQAIVR